MAIPRSVLLGERHRHAAIGHGTAVTGTTIAFASLISEASAIVNAALAVDTAAPGPSALLLAARTGATLVG